jgi:hypothetical protein
MLFFIDTIFISLNSRVLIFLSGTPSNSRSWVYMIFQRVCTTLSSLVCFRYRQYFELIAPLSRPVCAARDCSHRQHPFQAACGGKGGRGIGGRHLATHEILLFRGELRCKWFELNNGAFKFRKLFWCATVHGRRLRRAPFLRKWQFEEWRSQGGGRMR